MAKGFEDIVGYCQKMGLEVTRLDGSAQVVIVSAPDRAIHQMVIDCEGALLIFEQPIYQIKNAGGPHFKRLLQINRELVHGAFVMDGSGNWILFRDTLELENLDFNEFEGSINALSLGLAEFSSELLALNRG
ncbi:MAG: hypothetical protein A2508_05945 [Candidatus Lambdaproteobacteria bacterium RIFOXYD12_FULL_49_8]|uniref:Molecular chaperone Tir n=1 Tax=Candidatus Lambdaproteobacteria bacterium RIFOXYD2_FULL_50_16 TaxID=1817772 RepID=A0A1F6GGM0_9PROT|nr:MAG: hypothetical protein A2527_10435 [Candidatus Lambdaproteobacteria bacterium RIFOXYD2_FULL_50_16]OGG98061.1 MAG: hypothetical protein A2508_05945 [Candidatus Lambdaproteobacteria bacterium RIFOXYD12_FULL_49_8]